MILTKYISQNHSKFLIKYHIILVCKYRKQLLVGAVEYDMKKSCDTYQKCLTLTLKSW